MNKYLTMALAAVALAGLGYAFGRYAQPAQVQIKTVIQTKEVEVDHKNVVTTTHEVKKADGTEIIDTVTKDKSVDDTDISTKQQTTETITNLKPQWKIDGMAGISPSHSISGPVYGLGLEHRFIGPIFLGGYTRPQDKEFGLTLSVEF